MTEKVVGQHRRVLVVIPVNLADGNCARAARCYIEFRERLNAMLGIEPSPEMRALVASLIPSA